MEKMKALYSKELYGRMNGPNSMIDLMTGKIGHSFDPSKRGITTEFIKTINGSTDPTFVKKEVVREETTLLFWAPESFVNDFENYIHNVYLKGYPKTFPHITARQEYYNPMPATLSKIRYFNKIGGKFLTKLEDLEKRYLELNDAQVLSVNQINAEYKALFDLFKMKLNNFGLASKLRAPKIPAPLPGPASVSSKDVYDPSILIKDFVLYVDVSNNKAYLQGRNNKRHQLPSGRIPENIFMPIMKYPKVLQRSWSADLSTNGARFQWHDSAWAKSYRPQNPVATTIVDLFKKHGKQNADWFEL